MQPSSIRDATSDSNARDSTPSCGPDSLYIVGVGASAGGLEALQRLFSRMRPTGGLAFVVIQHLSPDFKSLMDELLAPHTSLAVRRAEDGMVVEADTIYLMPPRHEMTISGGRLSLTTRDPTRGLFLPIDLFFRSLGENSGSRAVGIVLSGTGSDGSRGVRTIHDAGGLVMAQDRETAKFDGMPRSAVATGVVDLVLPPEAMADALVRYLERDGKLGGDTEAPSPESADVMAKIFDLLRRESGVDFSEYKASTVGRRIERRLLLSESRDLEQYLDRIAHDPDELRSLYKDLLIGVTRFFRDPEAFGRLRAEVLSELLDRLPPGEELRVWVPGCATGEEPYTLAMTIAEAFRERDRAPQFRIFATDVHRHSLDVAGAGQYPADVMSAVPPELCERYFERKADFYCVSSELRGRVVFAHHNLLQDAPFTRLDVLSCRNLLIYFTPSAQRRALSLFHFALKTNGVLLLGPSESPAPLGDEFAPVDGRWKIFRKYRDVRLPSLRVVSAGPQEPPGRAVMRTPAEDSRVTRGRDALVARYLPPSVVIDEAGHVLHAFAGASDFLFQRDGRPTLGLLDLLEGEVRFAVAGALKRAQKERRAVVVGGISARTHDGERPVRVIVDEVPRAGRPDDSWIVTFEPEQTVATPATEVMNVPEDAGVDEMIRERVSSLEGELRTARENLQATLEEMETSNEELQATNEELIASNEELQSTNEELHSVNEELYTVNAEYQAKIAELTELTADMNHLLEATEVHTVFLDRDLRLRKFTPRIGDTFNLLPQDVGRRFDTFAHRLDDGRLMTDLADVAGGGAACEREVRDRDGQSYFLRILPYRTTQGIEGVVLTLVDISALKRAQHDLALNEERYRTLLRSITAIMWTADAEGRFAQPQAEWEAYTGHGWEMHRGDGWLSAIHPEDREQVRTRWREAVAFQKLFEAEGRIWSRSHGDYRRFVARAAPLYGDNGTPREWVGHVVDVHEAKTSELELRRKEEQIRGMIEHSPAFIAVKDPAGAYLVAGRQAQSILGAPVEQVIGKTDYELLPLAVADSLRGSERRVLETGEVIESEDVIPVGGEPRTFLGVRFPLRDEKGVIYAIASVATDITERKRATEEAREALQRRDRFLAMLSHELRTPLGAILNAAALLDREAQIPAALKETSRGIIRRQARHMAKLIDDLLDVGRISRDQIVIDARLLDLRSLVQEVTDAARAEAERVGLDLRVSLPPERLPVRGDAVRLRQVLTNLVSNAMTYTARGSVEVDMGRAGSQVVVEVRDTGVGLGPEELARVFDLFYQAPQSLDRPRGGLGVGLTLARRLVRLHGGEVVARSEGRNRGSVFQVTLPLAEEGMAATSERGVGPRPTSKLRVVVVEDNDDIRETLRELLLLDGHEVHLASDGPGGVDLIVRHRPDVAFVDLGLPGENGYDVARRVRVACGRGLRLVALTGYGQQEDRIAAIQAGFDQHVVKPVEPDALAQLLAEVEASRRL